MDRKPLKIGELTARIPVIQGGMGVGVSLGGLAGSVAAAGGVGVISTAQIGWREEDFKKNPMDANFRAVKK
ncbi:nitronate monooxygenase, partial [Clostridium butyricum]|nr:nitronate monooxygenase [Clostridium butyricum]